MEALKHLSELLTDLHTSEAHLSFAHLCQASLIIERTLQGTIDGYYYTEASNGYKELEASDQKWNNGMMGVFGNHALAMREAQRALDFLHGFSCDECNHDGFIPKIEEDGSCHESPKCKPCWARWDSRRP